MLVMDTWKKMSKLVWRTAVGGVPILAGTSKQFGVVDVTPYSKIRVVADERVGSGTGVVIRLTITEGNKLVAQLDTLQLAPMLKSHGFMMYRQQS
jgi:type III secretion protein HrpB1